MPRTLSSISARLLVSVWANSGDPCRHTNKPIIKTLRMRGLNLFQKRVVSLHSHAMASDARIPRYKMQRYLTPQDIRTWTRWTGGRHGREVTSAYLFLKPPRIDWIRVIAQAPRAAKTTCFSLKLSRQDVMNQAEPWKASTVDFFSRRLEYRAKGYLAGPDRKSVV